MYETGFEDPYVPARKELTTFAVITILLIIITIIYAGMCCANFNKGLKPYVSHKSRGDDAEKSGAPVLTSEYTGASGSGGYGYGQGVEMTNEPYGKGRVAPTRMEID